MRRWAIVLIFAVLVGCAAFWYTHHHCQAHRTTELAWLEDRLALSPAQVDAIAALQQAYDPICAGHCDQMAKLKARVQNLSAAGLQDSPAWREAQNALAAITEECQRSTHAHMEAVAKTLTPEQAKLYWELIVPRLASTPAPAS